MTDPATDRILALRDRLDALVLASHDQAKASSELSKTLTSSAARSLAVASRALGEAALAYAAALEAIPPQSLLAVLAALKTAHEQTKH